MTARCRLVLNADDRPRAVPIPPGIAKGRRRPDSGGALDGADRSCSHPTRDDDDLIAMHTVAGATGFRSHQEDNNGLSSYAIRGSPDTVPIPPRTITTRELDGLAEPGGGGSPDPTRNDGGEGVFAVIGAGDLVPIPPGMMTARTSVNQLLISQMTLAQFRSHQGR